MLDEHVPSKSDEAHTPDTDSRYDYRMAQHSVPGWSHTAYNHEIDIDAMISEAEKRVHKSLEVGYDYDNYLIDSNTFLHNNARRRVKLVVLYVDLVGSTKLAQTLPVKKQSIVVGCFIQEMASIIIALRGLALKFVGDAVIGYFVASNNPQMVTTQAVTCGKLMRNIVRKGINPVLTKYGYPEMRIRVGMDYGENTVIIYGSRSRVSHADLIGRSMNMAAKIQSAASPSQILIGRDIYIRLPQSIRAEFSQLHPEGGTLPYVSTRAGKPYQVYAHSSQ